MSLRYPDTLRLIAQLPARRFDLAETRLAILLRRRPDWAEA